MLCMQLGMNSRHFTLNNLRTNNMQNTLNKAMSFLVSKTRFPKHLSVAFSTWIEIHFVSMFQGKQSKAHVRNRLKCRLDIEKRNANWSKSDGEVFKLQPGSQAASEKKLVIKANQGMGNPMNYALLHFTLLTNYSNHHRWKPLYKIVQSVCPSVNTVTFEQFSFFEIRFRISTHEAKAETKCEDGSNWSHPLTSTHLTSSKSVYMGQNEAIESMINTHKRLL